MDYGYNSVNFSDLAGKVLSVINVKKDHEDSIEFVTEDGDVYAMFHYQDCCESVYIEDITGDLADLIELPILLAEEESSSGQSDYDSYTWTFYKLSTNKGSVTIRWNGTSNGYYSEAVTFNKIT